MRRSELLCGEFVESASGMGRARQTAAVTRKARRRRRAVAGLSFMMTCMPGNVDRIAFLGVLRRKIFR